MRAGRIKKQFPGRVHGAGSMNKVRLAVDVESGDFGARVMLRGVLDALKLCRTPLHVVLCGDRRKIRRMLAAEQKNSGVFRDRISVVHCGQRVEAEERRRIWVWKSRKDAAIIRCISLQKEGLVDASVSAGDTAVLMGAALFILGRRGGALRPALAALLPTMKRSPVLLLDVGANLRCRTEHLVSFASMGREYMREMHRKRLPRAALLNIGRERVKGMAAVGEADRLLRAGCSGYMGFIEGNQVLSGMADVVVCDGFAGNALLKTCESFYRLIASILRKKQRLLGELQKHIAVLDPENYGAVPFLGIKGIVFKAHGSSSRRAIASAVLAAERTVRLKGGGGLFT
jgi:glycerol-3-phosphate acyltransferase PlsX